MKEIQKDKHGFTVTKHKLSIRLIFKFLLTFAVCIYALYRCSLRACADTITLTPEQTIGLLGSSIQGQAYSETLGQYVTCYAFPTGYTSLDFVPPNSSDSFYTLASFNSSYPTINESCPLLNKRNYVIYAIYPTALDSVAWPSWNATDSVSRHNITCNFNLPIQSCTSLQFSILYTSSVTGPGYYGNVNNSNAFLNTSGPVVGRHPLGQLNIQSRYFMLPSPFYKAAGETHWNYADVPESRRENFALIPLDVSNNTPFSVSGFSLSLNMVRGSSMAEANNPLFNMGVSGGYIPLIYIQCPSISDYVPATTVPQTTPPPATLQPPMSTAPVETVDLSNLESGVAAIVGQLNEANNYLDWIGYNQYIAAADLDHIASTLDLIYAKMWDSGEVPQNAGLQPPNYDNLRNFAESALATRGSGVTTVSGFDMQGNFSTFFDVGKSLAGAPIFAPFILAASVGLAMAVLAFVLFRGH